MENAKETGKKRTRRPNFSSDELKALVEGAVKRKLMINGAFNPSITGLAKLNAWDAISKEVNANGIHTRTIPELKTKLKTYKSEAKKEGSTLIPTFLPSYSMFHYEILQYDLINYKLNKAVKISQLLCDH